MIFKKRLSQTRKIPYIYIPTPKTKKTSLQRRFLKFLFFLLFSAFLGVLIYFLFFSPYFKIKNIILVGNKNVTLSEVENQLRPLLEESYFSRNIFFFKSRRAKEILSQKIPSITSSLIKKNLPSSLEIRIEERTPQLVWQTGERRYFIGQDGVVFLELTDEDIRGLPLIRDQAKVTIQLGNKIVSPSFIKFVKDLVSKLPKKTTLVVDFISIKEVTFDIEVKTKQGISLFMDTTRGLDPQLSALVLAQKDAKKHGFYIWQYVDLRLENKVFYK